MRCWFVFVVGVMMFISWRLFLMNIEVCFLSIYVLVVFIDLVVVYVNYVGVNFIELDVFS